MVPLFSRLQSYLFLGFIFLLFFMHFQQAEAQDSTSNTRVGNFSRMDGPLRFAAEKLEKKIMCAFETLDTATKENSKERARAIYMARHLSKLFVRIHPKWGDSVVRHMIAQSVIETDYLRAVSEYKSKYASSRKKHKGRGGCQTTHRENYAKLAACSQKVIETDPAILRLFDVASQPPRPNAKLVTDPVGTMSESTELGQFYNAMSCPCYFIDTAMKHQKFANALQCEEERCVKEVGVGVNRGPGKLGKGLKPLKHRDRYKVFKEIGHCFDRVRK